MNLSNRNIAILTMLLSSMVVSFAQVPESVDLGLSVEWSAMNLGASVPEDFGSYFGWADPSGNETTTDVLNTSGEWISHFYGGTEPPSEISGTNLDIVYIRLGDGWRLPTLKDMQELIACPRQWTRRNGVSGYEITGKNGNKIFLPAAGARNGETVRYAGVVGYYWTGTLGTDPSFHKQRAHRLYLGAEGINLNPAIRYSGFSIRPVKDKNKSVITITLDDINSNIDNTMYDLTGRRLYSKPDRGFYIQNGKKHIVK